MYFYILVCYFCWCTSNLPSLWLCIRNWSPFLFHFSYIHHNEIHTQYYTNLEGFPTCPLSHLLSHTESTWAFISGFQPTMIHKIQGRWALRGVRTIWVPSQTFWWLCNVYFSRIAKVLLLTYIRIDFHMQMKICNYKYHNFKGCSPVALPHHIGTTSHPGHSRSLSYHHLPRYQCMPLLRFVLFTYVFSLFLEVSHGAATLTHFSLTHI